MATRFNAVHEDLLQIATSNVYNLRYWDYSSAFGHHITKMIFNLSDEEVEEIITDGEKDNGIDGLYFDHDEKIIHFFQYKFPEKKINKGFSETEINSTFEGYKSFMGTKDKFESKEWNNVLIDKRKEMLENEDYFHHKLWFIKYTTENDMKPLMRSLEVKIKELNKETGNTIEYEFISAHDILEIINKKKYEEWPNFDLPYVENLAHFKDDSDDSMIDAVIFHGYCSLKAIYETFKDLESKIYVGNVRYRNRNSPINKEIKDTIISSKNLFYLYNNGITLACNQIQTKTSARSYMIKHGSIINGAQTVGTIIDTLNDIDDLTPYETSFIHVKIIGFEQEKGFIDQLVYTLNTQNKMAPSYMLSNDPHIIKLQNEFNSNTEYFLEIKPNEFDFKKEQDENFSKKKKNLIEVETLIQAFVAFNNTRGLAHMSKLGKGGLFTKDNIEIIVPELSFEKANKSYEYYLTIMDLVRQYRAYRKDENKDDILKTLDIDLQDINDYKFLTTGNLLVLFGVGIYTGKHEVKIDLDKIISIIKKISIHFKNKDNIANLTKKKETFDKVGKLVKEME